jgi:hypothetical protein
VNSRQSQYLLIAAILAVLGVLALIGGIVYLTTAANKLPSFFPGHMAHLKDKRTKRGTAGIVVAAVLFVIAGISVATARRRPSSA